MVAPERCAANGEGGLAAIVLRAARAVFRKTIAAFAAKKHNVRKQMERPLLGPPCVKPKALSCKL